MNLSKILMAGIMLSLSAPAAALAGEVVNFSFKKSELATPASRQLLLDRIEAHSFRSCDSASAIATAEAIRRCAEDLRDQFINAIDDESLTLLAQSSGRRPYHTARR